MKKITLLSAFLSVILFSYSQNEIIAVSPTKMNIFYVGVENPINVAVFNVQENDLTVSVSKGTIIKRHPGKYTVKVNSTEMVYVILKKEGKEIAKIPFRCKRIPDPIARVGNLTLKPGGSILKSALLSQTGIAAYIKEDFEFDINFVVEGFSVSTIIKGYPRTEYSKTNKFSAKQKKIINSAPRGQKIYIDDIKAKSPDGKVRQLNPLVFKVK